LRVAVIGGAGRMGRLFARYFAQRGNEVIISDINLEEAVRFAGSIDAEATQSNTEAAGSSELIVICTPIMDVPRVIDEIIHDICESAIVLEISSIKSPVISAMRMVAEAGGRPLSIHPLFGPGAGDPSGERMALIPISDEKSEVELARSIFPNVSIIPVDLERHDRIMALALSLTHLINVVFASTIAEENIAELKRIGGKTFGMQLLLCESVMTESPDLSVAIQMSNPFAIEYLERFSRIYDKLLKYIRGKRKGEFIKFHREVYSALSRREDLSDSYRAMYRALRAIGNDGEY